MISRIKEGCDLTRPRAKACRNLNVRLFCFLFTSASRPFFLKNEEAWPSLVGYLIVVSGLVYFMVGVSVSYALWITVLLVILAHSASGANWVLSTVMMQQWVEDEVRGRVFSTDMLILSVAFSTSTSVAGYLMENTNLGIQNGIMVFASVMVLSGLVFSMWKPEPPMTKLHSA